MSTYQVFARKYRPQTFDDVVGQEHITRTLKNAIAQNRLAHAFLFVGPRGIGKTSTARILAKCLCCVNAPTVLPCGVCDACREIAAGIALDVLEIDGASNNGVEQVRELRDNVRYAPTRGKYRIYIIDEVHMLTSAAFNALLKTLEEPPEHVKFIFATTEPQKVLATILSRCQRFDLRRIPTQLIAGHLQKISSLEGIKLEDDAAQAIAVGADGGLRDAESMLDQLVAFCGERIAADDVCGIFGFTAPETVSKLAAHLLGGRTADALAMLDAQSAAGKDLLRLLSDLITHFRNLLVFQVNPASLEAEATGDTLAAFQEQSALAGTGRLLELIDQFAVAEQRMKWAPNKKLQFEIALIKSIQTLGQSTLDDVLDTLTAIRDGDPAGGAAKVPQSVKASGGTPPEAKRPPVESVSIVAETPGKFDFADLKRAVAPPSPAAPPAPLVVAEAAVPAAIEAAAPVAAPPGSQDGPRIWADLIREIRSQRPLITSWVQSGAVLSVDSDIFQVGFPAGDRMIVESLNKPNHRKFLETLLTRLAGRAVTLQLVLQKEGDPPLPVPLAIEPAAASAASAAPKPSTAEDAIAAFKNDPLIQKALQVFQGEIQSVELPSSTP